VTSRALFPAPADCQALEEALTSQLAAAEQAVISGSVVPTFNPGVFRSQLAAFDFTRPCPIGPVCDWVIAALLDGVVHVNHPRYFGLFNPTPTVPARLAERITATFNPQLATHTTSPTAVEIENHVVAAFAGRLGFADSARGHFTTGGAEANYTALLMALHAAGSDFAARGARSFAGDPVFYVSGDSHLAWVKIAAQAGIGRNAVRFVDTDDTGRMNGTVLADMIAQDRARGCCPVMIAATAGTTNAGMIDPLEDCAAIAARFGLWFHVDAAWGGALIASDTLRHHLNGIARADSVTIDGHKWFATTMGCGLFMTQRAEMLSRAFHVAAHYMPSAGADLDPYLNSVQWSRRFLGLRLFLSLAVAGWDGYAAHIEHSLSLAGQLRQKMLAEGWSVVNDSSVGVLCLLPPRKTPVRALVSRVLASGRAWVSAARFAGRDVVRACVTSGLTTEADVTELATILVLAAEANGDYGDE
jgi:glutamate/tyrosine decarboxylase-like PLP-dependent enzyme